MLTTVHNYDDVIQYCPYTIPPSSKGMWSQQIAKDAGAAVPLWPCEHEYVLTEAMPEASGLPVVRSYDEYLYIKEDAGRILIG